VDHNHVIIVLFLNGLSVGRNDGDASGFLRLGLDDKKEPSPFLAGDGLLESCRRKAEGITRLYFSQFDLLWLLAWNELLFSYFLIVQLEMKGDQNL
jgi:hypothetical protein